MILHAIELRCVGPFCDDLRLGPFARGLNILAAPNESGKTTALRAAARALFDRHTTKSEELKSLQPAGTDLAPCIAVEFEIAAARYRIEKTFLQSPTSRLQRRHGDQWELLAEGDAADRRVQEVLESSLPGRGATKPEHWGLLGFLWARQGEPAAWPTLSEGETGQKIRSRLVQIELDPTIERLREKLAAIADEIVTPSGRPRVNGPLESAEKELSESETALAAVQQSRLELEATRQRFRQASDDVAQLEREQADRETSARAASEQAAAADRLRTELETRQSELAAAQARLQAVSRDLETMGAHQAGLTTARTALEKSEKSASDAETQLAEIRRRIDALQATRPEKEQQAATLRAAHRRVQSLMKLRQSAAQATALGRQLQQVEESAGVLAELRQKESRLPALTPATLKQIQDLTDRVKTLRAQVEALGLTVELTPERAGSAVVHADGAHHPEKLSAGKTTRLRSPQHLDVELKGWGRVVIRSGAEEGRNATAELERAGTALQAALEKAEVASLEAAREAVAARHELGLEIKSAGKLLGQHLGEWKTPEALRENHAAATRRAEATTASMQPTADEEALTPSALDSEDARLTTAIPPAEKVLEAIDRELGKLREEEREISGTLQQCASRTSDCRTEVRTLETQVASLTARYSEGLETAKSRAGAEFVEAEARHQVARDSLPPDFAQLPGRNRRAAVALQQLLEDLKIRRAERDHAAGTLQALGGQGLYSRETELEERKTALLLRRDAARTRGGAARLAQVLIERHKQAATRAVLAPLEDRLSAAFAQLSGAPDRRVFLDDNLQIAGIGRTRGAVHSFELLSQGAREQLLLCLRLAVAQELATDEPQSLILDDVLVNTDPVRQERVLDLLGTLSADLQILVLTCHPDRYRGAGSPINFSGG